MILKPGGNLEIMKMYIYIKNEVARLRHWKRLITYEVRMANEKNAKIALRVKGQGQMSPTSNHF